MSAIVAAVRAMAAAPELWRQNGPGGVWYMRLEGVPRLGLVYSDGRGGWWWRWNPTGAARCTRSQRRAMLECQRAAAGWILGGGGWRRTRRRAAPAKLTPADIDQCLAAAPAIIREVQDQLAGSVWP